MLKEKLPGLPSCREVEYKIEIIGTISKLSAIYKLSPLEDKTLKEHPSEALKMNLICVSKSPFGAVVFFLHKKGWFTAPSNSLLSAQCHYREKWIPASADQ